MPALFRKTINWLPKGSRQGMGISGIMKSMISDRAIIIVDADNWVGVDTSIELTILFQDPVDENTWHVYEELPVLTETGNSSLIFWTNPDKFLPHMALVKWSILGSDPLASVDFGVVAETA